jgi:dihydroneopterin aldolase
MADTLLLQGIAVECRLGVYEWEQQTPQTIWIDVELAIDASRAAAQDDVCAAIDYSRLVDAIKQLAQRSAYRLMETLAETIASHILSAFKTPQVLVRVKKRAVPGIDYAAVEISRAAS